MTKLEQIARDAGIPVEGGEMAQPTQGEWEISRGRFDVYEIFCRNERGRVHIATIHDFNRFDREAEVKANADLFFNARETLAALEWALRYVEYMEPSETAIDGSAADDFIQGLSKLRDAIKKARGQ